MDESLNNDFLDAVKRGDTALVTELISKGANIEVRDEQGQTPLLIASRGDNYYYLDVVRVLIQAKCDLKAKDHSEQNALHKVILGGLYGENIAEILLDTGKVEYDLKDNQGKSPLDYAKDKWSGHKDPRETIEKILDIKCQNLLKEGDFETLFSDQDLVIYLIKIGSPKILNAINFGISCGIGINVNAPGICYIKSPLYYAFREGHSALFKKLIDLGADIGALEIDGLVPLNYNYPSLKADFDILSILVQQGFNLNAQDEQGKSALYLALEYSQKETAAALIRLGCDVNLPDKDGRSPLQKVMQATLEPSDRMSLIDMLLVSGANIGAKDKDGKTPLHKVMEVYFVSPEEKVEILNRFLQKDVDINDRDRYGHTSFRKALDVYLKADPSYGDDLSTLSMVIINRADPNKPKYAEFRTTLDIYLKTDPSLLYKKDLSFLDMLIANGTDPNTPEYIELRKVLDVYLEARSELCLELDMNFTNPDTYGYIKLREALDIYLKAKYVFCDKKALSVLGMLLEKVSDPNISDYAGSTLMDVIAQAPSTDRKGGLLEYILRNAKVNNPNHLGQNILHIAAKGADAETILKLLEKYPEDAGFKDYQGRTLLHFAALNADLKVSKMILERFPDLINEKDLQGNVPLHLAVRRGDAQKVKLFIEYQSNIKAVDKSGKTPMDYASMASDNNSIILLLDYAIQQKDVKIIAQLMHLGAPIISLKKFNVLIQNTLDGVECPIFVQLMLKCLDPKKNILKKDPKVCSKALEQICQKVDEFKDQLKTYAQSETYSKLEGLKDIYKSLNNVLDNSDYFNFFDQKEELLKLCQELLPFTEKEYSTLSEKHFEHLLSKSDYASLDKYELKKTPDAHLKKVVALYLKNEGHKLIEVSKAGIFTLDLIIQTQPIKDLDNVAEVKETGASDEGGF